MPERAVHNKQIKLAYGNMSVWALGAKKMQLVINR